MQLNHDTLIAGRPAVQIRELLRHWPDAAGAGLIAERLAVPLPNAEVLLQALIGEGYLEGGKQPRIFALTLKGASLTLASAAKPLRRETVDAKLTELVARMVHVNTSDDFLCGVQAAFLFGSYLSEKQRLGDLDVSLTLYRKEVDGDRFVDRALHHAASSGRSFNTYIDRLYWCERQVFLYLKQRSRVYSLHQDEGLLTSDPSVPRKAIFLDRHPVLEVTTSPALHREPRPRGNAVQP